MDERARIPVTLPRPNPTQSYWQDPPDPSIADLRTTPTLPTSADTIIIGSGITGAAIAWHLLQSASSASQSILMLEARQACSGATGRNGGHTKAASYRSYLHHSTLLSPSAAVQIARLELSNILAVHHFAREHSIPCDLNPCRTIDIIYDPVQWDQAQEAVTAMREAMPPGDPAAEYEFFSADEVRESFHVHDGVYNGREEKVQGGVGYLAGSLSGYMFTVGVLKMCLEKGMGLQTNTPVVGLEKEGEEWVVRTERGDVRAGRVVVATNGYAAALVKELQGVVVPLRGQVTAQRPGRGMEKGGCLERTYSFIYEKGYEYMVTSPQGSRFAGDVIMGGGLVRSPEAGLEEYGTTDDTTLNKGISEYLKECTARYFGPDWGEDHPDGRMRKEWTGIMGFSPDGFPFVGEMPGQMGLWVCCAFQGHGMVLCWKSAIALAEMMGGDGELDSWFPQIFKVTEERLAKVFEGRLHTSAMPAGDQA